MAAAVLYSRDASNYRQIPIGVVSPEIDRRRRDRRCRVCRRHGAPMLGRGGGTSLAGQCVNVAVVVDFSKYLHQRARDRSADGGRESAAGNNPGRLAPQAGQHGLTFGPDPATHNHCTLGGMIGNNSCGIHSVMAGRPADNVEELEVLTYDGLRMKVGPTATRS